MANEQNFDKTWYESCVKAQAIRIKRLEKMVINLGGNPNGGDDGK